MKRIYLIDCPGVVPPSNNDSPEDILLRGVVRVENVENPEQYIAAVLKKTKPQHIERTYDVKGFSTPLEFLELLARKGGRLHRGGEADVDGAAKMVLNDFLRGKIPWYTPPPVSEGEKTEEGIEGRKGALGEMGKVAMLQDLTPTILDPDIEMEATNDLGFDGGEEENGDEFDGFDEEDEESMNSSGDEKSGSENDTTPDSGGVVLEAPG